MSNRREAMEDHSCVDHFFETLIDRSDTKIVVKGFCTLCLNRMMKIFRYQGTYERSDMNKLDPKAAKE